MVQELRRYFSFLKMQKIWVGRTTPNGEKMKAIIITNNDCKLRILYEFGLAYTRRQRKYVFRFTSPIWACVAVFQLRETPTLMSGEGGSCERRRLLQEYNE